MGGGGTETSTQTNVPSNPDVNPTLSKLLQGVQGVYDSTASSSNPAPLNAGWSSQIAAAGNPDYARGVNSAMADFAGTAAGNKFGQADPGYAALRAKAGDDTLRDVNSTFTASGRFGSGSHVDQATESLGNVYAGLDYQNHQNDIARQERAAGMLPSLFAAGQAPGSVLASVGEQQRGAPWYNLGQASSILAGTAGTGGSTSSMTQPTAPWWQQALGYVAGNAGKAFGAF
jgi:hypothetical protein